MAQISRRRRTAAERPVMSTRDTRTTDIVALTDERVRKASKGEVCVAWALKVWMAARYDARYRPRTVRTYKRSVELARQEFGEEIPTRGKVEIWMNKLAVTMKPQTVNLYKKSLAAVCSEAAMATSRHEAHVMADALAGARLLRVGAKSPRCPPRWVMRAILQDANAQEVCIVRLLAVCGIRIGEARALEWRDVCLDSGRIVISKSMSDDGMIGPRKNRDDHIVIADKTTRKVLREWQQKQKKELEESKNNGRLGGCEKHGLVRVISMTNAQLRKLKAKWKKKTEGNLNTWHELRHLGASIVAERTGSTAKVQEYLGDKTASAAQCYMPALRSITQCTIDDVASVLDKDGR